MSVCAKFEVDSSNTFGVTLWKPKLTFVTLKIKVTTPKWISFPGGLWGSYTPGFDLIAVILFELSCRNGCLTKIDLFDLCDLENQGHNPKTSSGDYREAIYIRFQFDRCNTFWVITWKRVSSDRQRAGQTDGQWHTTICPSCNRRIIINIICCENFSAKYFLYTFISWWWMFNQCSLSMVPSTVCVLITPITKMLTIDKEK